MPIYLDHNTLTAYLQRFLTYNKARGMVAELALKSELGIHGNIADQKLLAGGWLVSPQMNMPHNYRYIVSVLPQLYSTPDELQHAIDTIQQDRGWQALATFMSQSGIGMIVSGAHNEQALSTSLEKLNWCNHI